MWVNLSANEVKTLRYKISLKMSSQRHSQINMVAQIQIKNLNTLLNHKKLNLLE